MAVSAKSAFKTLDDLKKSGSPVKFTATGFGSTAYAATGIAAAHIGINVQQLTDRARATTSSGSSAVTGTPPWRPPRPSASSSNRGMSGAS